jgi:hypothetical protein
MDKKKRAYARLQSEVITLSKLFKSKFINQGKSKDLVSLTKVKIR